MNEEPNVTEEKDQFDASLLDDILNSGPDDELFPGIRRPSAPSVAILKAIGSPIITAGSNWQESPNMLIDCLVFIGVHHLPWGDVIKTFRDKEAFEARVLTEYESIPFDKLKELPKQIINMMRRETETQVNVIPKDEGKE
jgi:hypothetical protein